MFSVKKFYLDTLGVIFGVSQNLELIIDSFESPLYCTVRKT